MVDSLILRAVSPLAGRSALVALVGLAPALTFAQPSVTNVSASQLTDGSKNVEITYDVSGGDGPMTVDVLVSIDGGENYNVVPYEGRLHGHVGPGIFNGTGHTILWEAGVDFPEVYWPQTSIRITATEGPPWPGFQSRVIDLPEGHQIEMIRIPAGSFTMGAPESERSSGVEERPLTEVTFTKGFYMSRYLITEEQWLALMGDWPVDDPNDPPPREDWGTGPQNPANWLHWYDAWDFANAVNDYIVSTGQQPLTTRLPSEAEWEYAARAGTQTRFSFGDSLGVDDGCEDDGIRGLYAWYCGNGDGKTQPVGLKAPNPWGLYDMHGNVRGWIADSPQFYPGGSVTDPQPPSDIGDRKMLRGGHFLSEAKAIRSAARDSAPIRHRGPTMGIRLVAPVPD